MSVHSHLLNDKKSRGSLWQTLAKIAFFVIAAILIFLTTLANIGGSNDVLKGGIEGYLSSSFRRPAHIKTLNNMSFFPSIRFDFSDAYIMADSETNFPVVQIGHVRASMKFWNMFFGKPDVREFLIEDFETLRGVLLPHAVKLDRVYIDHDIEADAAYLRGMGSIDVHPLEFSIKLDVRGQAKPYSYRFSGNSEIDFKLSDLHVSATLQAFDEGYLKVSNFVFETAQGDITGEMTLSMPETGILKIKGDLQYGSGNSTLYFNLNKRVSQSVGQISGMISSDVINASDIWGDHGLMRSYGRMRTLLGFDQESMQPHAFKNGVLFGHNMDLDVHIDRFAFDTGYSAALKFSMKQVDGHLMLSTVKDGDEVLLPSWGWFSSDAASSYRDAVMLGGAFNPELLNAMNIKLDQDFINAGSTIDCAIGRVTQEDDQYKAVLNIMEGTQAYTSEVTSEFDSIMPFDLSQLKRRDGAVQDKITLPYNAYKMIQAEIQKNPEGSACDQYLNKVEAPKIPELQQVEE